MCVLKTDKRDEIAMEQKITILKEFNKQRIHSFLKTDRIWAGYAICDLEEDLFPVCDWYTAYKDNEVISLCMYFKGIQPPAQITMGELIGLEKILKAVNLPRRVHAHIPLNHREIVNQHYYFSELHSMKRMFVTREFFRPAAGQAKKMSERDLKDLEKLYAIQPGNFFRSYMLTSGVYYGLRSDGTLVSVAGTHVCSTSYSLACVGNVFTHPSYRGRGYATICTSQVVRELLTRYRDVILNVADQNTVAIRIYKQLGFHEYCTFLEADAHAF